MTAAEWIAKRRELLDAATEGPWEADGTEIWALPVGVEGAWVQLVGPEPGVTHPRVPR